MNELLRKDCPKNLPEPSEEQLTAFNLLREALISAPILRLPDPSRPYSVDTDACNHQIGAALFQTDDNGVRHPVGFWSRSLLPAEKNYSASERECLGVVWAVQILRPYLEGKPFVVHTDHAALRWMFNLADASNRLARWRLRLLEFDFEIRYRNGAENTVADTISRLPTFGHTNVAPDLDIPCLMISDGVSNSTDNKLRVLNQVDSESWENIDWDSRVLSS